MPSSYEYVEYRNGRPVRVRHTERRRADSPPPPPRPTRRDEPEDDVYRVYRNGHWVSPSPSPERPQGRSGRSYYTQEARPNRYASPEPPRERQHYAAPEPPRQRHYHTREARPASPEPPRQRHYNTREARPGRHASPERSRERRAAPEPYSTRYHEPETRASGGGDNYNPTGRRSPRPYGQVRPEAGGDDAQPSRGPAGGHGSRREEHRDPKTDYRGYREANPLDPNAHFPDFESDEDDYPRYNPKPRSSHREYPSGFRPPPFSSFFGSDPFGSNPFGSFGSTDPRGSTRGSNPHGSTRPRGGSNPYDSSNTHGPGNSHGSTRPRGGSNPYGSGNTYGSGSGNAYGSSNARGSRSGNAHGYDGPTEGDRRPAADPYTTLGVSRNASDGDIKKAYHKLALKHHPDRQKTEAEKKKAGTRMAEILNAYEILKDQKKREYYDRTGMVNTFLHE